MPVIFNIKLGFLVKRITTLDTFNLLKPTISWNSLPLSGPFHVHSGLRQLLESYKRACFNKEATKVLPPQYISPQGILIKLAKLFILHKQVCLHCNIISSWVSSVSNIYSYHMEMRCAAQHQGSFIVCMSMHVLWCLTRENITCGEQVLSAFGVLCYKEEDNLYKRQLLRNALVS